jgi:hypothetical protein
MALALTPAEYDPTGILQKQRELYVAFGVMQEITAALLALMEDDEPEDDEPEGEPAVIATPDETPEE